MFLLVFMGRSLASTFRYPPSRCAGEQLSQSTSLGSLGEPHSGLRRHKLRTKELADTIPPLYANDGADDAVVAKAKLFSPYTGWRWYITEWEAETGLCFGLVEGFETELGYFGAPRDAA